MKRVEQTIPLKKVLLNGLFDVKFNLIFTLYERLLHRQVWYQTLREDLE